MGQLARIENIAPPTITGIVARLEEKGLVHRGPDPEDARSTRVAVSEAGLDAVGAIRRERTAFLVERIGQLDPDERETLRAATRVLAGMVEE